MHRINVSMLKLILSLTILLLTTGIGFLITSQYRNRVHHLRDLITAMDLLESDMIYRKDPMAVISANIGRQGLGLASELFSSISIRLELYPDQDLRSHWLQGVEEVYGVSSLLAADLSVIQGLGSQLGRSGMEGQKLMVQNQRRLLEHQLSDAREIQMKRSKVIQSLATAAGILLVILLV